MAAVEFILKVIAVLVIIAALVPLVRRVAWWIRVFDFPRLQIGTIGIGAAIGLAIVWEFDRIEQIALMVALLLASLWEFAHVIPYSPLRRKQIVSAALRDDRPNVSLAITNVHHRNRNAAAHISTLRDADPDMILAVEVNSWWAGQLSALEEFYPHTLCAPFENGHGMYLLSRYEITDAEVRFLTRDGVPSIRARIVLNGNESFMFYGVHPPPPFPGFAWTSLPRDAELVKIGFEVEKNDEATIVAGDLNDVAWSYTTRLFQRISRLLDPRIGRGLYNSFHAKLWFARWPLDHVFVTKHFTLITMRRLPAGGSDHFPIYAHIAFTPEHAPKNEVLPPRTRADVVDAHRTISADRRISDSEL